MRRISALCLPLCVAAGSTEAQQPYRTLVDVEYLRRGSEVATFDVMQPTYTTNGVGIVYFMAGCWKPMRIPPKLEQASFAFLLDGGFTVFVVRPMRDTAARIPDVVGEARSAVVQIQRDAAQYGIDGSRLGLMGASAGGHLALTIGNGRNPSRLPGISAVAAFFAPSDLRILPKLCPALDLSPESLAAYSPVTFALEGAPPTLLLQRDRDSTVVLRHSETLHHLLESAGVSTELVILRGLGHSWPAVPVPGISDGRPEALAWFRRHLPHER